MRQRTAIANGIVPRGGRAEPGRAGGRLRLMWSVDTDQAAPRLHGGAVAPGEQAAS
ncbi:hypothetical protein [Sphingomonas sp. UV9]|uniref:hypothetical protein n=1 Tax=Sphingomonas sp. UV9 TaxID=1851410 RepID=UPI0013E8F558|nr:hypothetical protein [Sphingomonas sp. UV9]